MQFLTRGWSLDPFVVLTVVVGGWYGVGLGRIRRSGPGSDGARTVQAVAVVLGLVVLDLAVSSPIDYTANRYFWVHMVQHLLLMFAAPILVVVGAPWRALAAGLPDPVRARLGTALDTAPWAAPFRAVGRFLWRPWVAVVAFNLAMLVWHVPSLFDLAWRHREVQIWAMHGSLFLFGVLFWLQFVGSFPSRPKLAPLAQVSALFGTNVVMFLMAVTIGMLSTSSWYSVYDHLPGVSLSALGDQHLGAGILWVCGDFWCLPAMVRALRQFIADDEARDFDSLVNRLLRGA